MEYVEAHKITSPEQEGFRTGRPCSRAITHLSLCIEDAHTHDKDILIAYIDFTQAFPSADHTQLSRTLRFLGIPEVFIFISTNLYNGAHTTFQIPHGYTRLIKVLRGTLQGDPLSSLLFLLMVEPLIRWFKSLKSKYTLTSNNLILSNKWYADDATLIAYTVTELNTQLEAVNTFSEWSGIRLNISKYRLTGYIHALQLIKQNTDRDTALQACLVHVRVGTTPIPIISQDDPLPCSYLGTAITTTLCPKAHLTWTLDTLDSISKTVLSTPLPPGIKHFYSYTEPTPESWTRTA
jgi:hypothetical protein